MNTQVKNKGYSSTKYLHFHVYRITQPIEDQKPLKTGTLTNNEDPDEMPHKAAFHQDLHCLMTLNQSSKKQKQYFQ